MSNPVSQIPANLSIQQVLDRSTAAAKDPSKVSQDQFLQLMLAQLKNQDPSKPMDNNEFVTQMAQISAASSMNDLKTSFGTLASALQSTQALQASTMVGRKVLVASNNVTLLPGQQPKLGFDIPTAATTVQIAINDAAGQTVRQINVNAPAAGISEVTWDGLNSNGTAVAPGVYTVKATAIANGQTQAATALVEAPVESVTLTGSGNAPSLNLTNLGAFSLDAIKRVM